MNRTHIAIGVAGAITTAVGVFVGIGVAYRYIIQFLYKVGKSTETAPTVIDAALALYSQNPVMWLLSLIPAFGVLGFFVTLEKTRSDAGKRSSKGKGRTRRR